MSTDTSEPELFFSSKDRGTGILKFIGFNPKNLKVVEDFPVHPDDIFLCGFPKSGNIWTLTIIMAIMNQDNLESFFEREFKNPSVLIEMHPNAALKLPHPGVFMSHLPYDLLPKRVHEMKVKVINIIRNPKDVAVSYFHFHKIYKNLLPFAKPWDEFFDDFLNGRNVYDNYFHHVRSFRRVHNEPNLFKVEYEDLKEDLRHWIAKIAEFLGKPLSDEKLAKITEMTEFENMKENPNLNPINFPMFVKGSSFMRKGQVGDWRNLFTEDQSERMDEEYRKWL